jgi:hypothetical protein
MANTERYPPQRRPVTSRKRQHLAPDYLIAEYAQELYARVLARLYWRLTGSGIRSACETRLPPDQAVSKDREVAASRHGGTPG